MVKFGRCERAQWRAKVAQRHVCTFRWSLPSECWMRRSNSLICRWRRCQASSEPYQLARVLWTFLSFRVFADISSVWSFRVFADISRRTVASNQVWTAFKWSLLLQPRQQQLSEATIIFIQLTKCANEGTDGDVSPMSSGPFDIRSLITAHATFGAICTFDIYTSFFSRDWQILQHKQWRRKRAQD